jgi:hypothetical protein
MATYLIYKVAINQLFILVLLLNILLYSTIIILMICYTVDLFAINDLYTVLLNIYPVIIFVVPKID